MSERRLNYPEKVQRAIDEGRFWRAREMLAGRLQPGPYSPELCEQYGAVLLALGEMMHAGMHLFLSGSTDPAYREAIDIYLQRSRKHGLRGLMAGWPRCTSRARLADFPESVRRELSALGMPDEHEPDATLADARLKNSSDGAAQGKTCGCIFLVVLAVLVVLALAIGLYHLGGLVTSWFS